MAMEEHHDLPDGLLLGPSRSAPFRTNRTDATDVLEAIGIDLDDIENLLAECLDELPGIDRPDAADHA
jgi:hypothetical protein